MPPCGVATSRLLRGILLVSSKLSQYRMNEPNDPKPGIPRRDLIKGVTAASLGLAAGSIGIPNSIGNTKVSSASRQNLIRIENAKPGTRD